MEDADKHAEDDVRHTLHPPRVTELPDLPIIEETQEKKTIYDMAIAPPIQQTQMETVTYSALKRIRGSPDSFCDVYETILTHEKGIPGEFEAHHTTLVIGQYFSTTPTPEWLGSFQESLQPVIEYAKSLPPESVFVRPQHCFPFDIGYQIKDGDPRFTTRLTPIFFRNWFESQKEQAISHMGRSPVELYEVFVGSTTIIPNAQSTRPLPPNDPNAYLICERGCSIISPDESFLSAKNSMNTYGNFLDCVRVNALMAKYMFVKLFLGAASDDEISETVNMIHEEGIFGQFADEDAVKEREKAFFRSLREFEGIQVKVEVVQEFRLMWDTYMKTTTYSHRFIENSIRDIFGVMNQNHPTKYNIIDPRTDNPQYYPRFNTALRQYAMAHVQLAIKCFMQDTPDDFFRSDNPIQKGIKKYVDVFYDRRVRYDYSPSTFRTIFVKMVKSLGFKNDENIAAIARVLSESPNPSDLDEVVYSKIQTITYVGTTLAPTDARLKLVELTQLILQYVVIREDYSIHPSSTTENSLIPYLLLCWAFSRPSFQTYYSSQYKEDTETTLVAVMLSFLLTVQKSFPNIASSDMISLTTFISKDIPTVHPYPIINVMYPAYASPLSPSPSPRIRNKVFILIIVICTVICGLAWLFLMLRLA